MKMSPDISLLKELKSKVHEALKAWHVSTGTPDNLLENLSLVQMERRAMIHHENGTPRLATNKVLLAGMQELAIEDAVGEEILQLRFLAGASLKKVAHKINLSIDTVSRLQRQAIEHLTKILYRLEVSSQENRVLVAEAQLQPSSYKELFGLQETAALLVKKLTQSASPWVVTITGIGGIGKTALADMVARAIIRRSCFDQVVWLRMEGAALNGRSSPENLYHIFIYQLAERLCPEEGANKTVADLSLQVRQILKKRPYLIVIDNLESFHDTAFLLFHLNDLANPSKFLLTTRTHSSEKTAVFNHSLKQLSRSDSIALLRQYIQETGITGEATATETDLLTIYRVVGGNPQALKLIVNLLDLLPLTKILEHVRQGRESSIENMYRHIYQQTWQTLGQEARHLLKIMPLVREEGEDADYLQTLSGLSDSQLWPALTELRNRSLIEVRGTLNEKRYGIHRLTEIFLGTEIIRLQTEELNKPSTPDAQFLQGLYNGLTYWQQQTHQLDDATIQELDKKRHNLYRVLQIGLLWPEVWQKTAQVVLQTFHLAERRGYWEEWKTFLQHLLQHCPETELVLQLQLLNRLGHLHILSQKRTEAIATHQQAKTIAETLKDARALAEIHHHLLQDYRDLSQFAEAEQHGQAALTYFQQQPVPDKWLAGTLQLLGVVAREQGMLQLSQERLAQSVVIWRTLIDGTALARALSDYANTLGQDNQYEAALACLDEAAQLLDATANEFDKTMVQINRGVLFYALKRWAEAETAFLQANSPYLRQSNHIYYQALVATNLGHVYLEIGRFPAAESQLRLASEQWLQIKDGVSRANVLGKLGELYGLQQKIKQAMACYSEAIDILERYPDIPRAQKLKHKFLQQRQTIDEQTNSETTNGG